MFSSRSPPIAWGNVYHGGLVYVKCGRDKSRKMRKMSSVPAVRFVPRRVDRIPPAGRRSRLCSLLVPLDRHATHTTPLALGVLAGTGLRRSHKDAAPYTGPRFSLELPTHVCLLPLTPTDLTLPPRLV